MSNRSIRTLAVAAATSLFLIGGTAIAASAPPVKMPMPAPAMHAAKPSKKEIHEFAEVYVKVASIRNEYRQKLFATKDQDKIKKLKQEGAKKLDSAVADSALGIKRYNQIAHAVSGDSDLKQKIIAQIKQIRHSH